MGKRLRLIKEMNKILKEVARRPELEGKLEPFVLKMQDAPHDISLVEDFIAEFNRVKNE